MVELKYSYLTYTPTAYRRSDFDEKEMRREYSRLRKVSMKRIARLKKAGYDDRFIQYYEKRMPFLKDIHGKAALSKALSIQSRFIISSMSSVTGRRKQEQQSLQTLREHGYNIQKDDIREFGKFMQYARSLIDSVFFDSARAATFFEENYNSDAIDEMYREYQKREKIPLRYKPDNKSSSSDF